MKAVGSKTIILLTLLVIVSLFLSGCTAYSGFWGRLWERLGFDWSLPEEKPESPPPEEDRDDPGELVEDEPETLNEFEEKVFTQINNYRANKGLNTLAIDERLVDKPASTAGIWDKVRFPLAIKGFKSGFRQ